MNTTTQTYTETDARRVFENFEADLRMLAIRTQAMELDHVQKYAHDICLMAQEGGLSYVHIHLYDLYGNWVKVYRYSVVGEDIPSVSQRPGGNQWPCLPSGRLQIIIQKLDNQKFKELKRLGKLNINWVPSPLSAEDLWEEVFEPTFNIQE